MLKDAEIIKAIKMNQNGNVLDALYDSALPSISKFVRSNGGNQDDADDAFQDGLVRLIIAVKKGEFKEEYSIRNYLFGIVRNRWFSEVKKRVKHVANKDIEKSIESNEVKLLEIERAQVLRKLVDSLGERCAEILKLFLYENKRQKEIKELMNMASESVVKVTYFRCKKKLQDKIQNSPELINVLRD